MSNALYHKKRLHYCSSQDEHLACRCKHQLSKADHMRISDVSTFGAGVFWARLGESACRSSCARALVGIDLWHNVPLFMNGSTNQCQFMNVLEGGREKGREGESMRPAFAYEHRSILRSAEARHFAALN